MNQDRHILKSLLLELLEIPDETREEDLIEEIRKSSPDPDWSDYIYQSDEYSNSDGTIMIDEVLDKIFSYKPIIL